MKPIQKHVAVFVSRGSLPRIPFAQHHVPTVGVAGEASKPNLICRTKVRSILRWRLLSATRVLVLAQEEKVNSYRRNAVVVGILFIIATAAPLASAPFLNPVGASNYLNEVSSNATLVTTGVLLELVMALAIAGIAIGLYPVLRRHSESLAVGYVGIRIIEGVLFIGIAATSLMSLVTLSQEYAQAGIAGQAGVSTVGGLLVATHDWAYLISGQLVFSVSAIVLNYVLYRSRLVPRFISVWGLIGAVLLLAGALLLMFDTIADDSLLGTIAFIPIAVNEMVLAVWLIARGFSRSAMVTSPAYA